MMRRGVIVLVLSGCQEDASPVSNAGIDDSPIEGVCMPGDGDDPYADCVESFVPGEGATFGHAMLPDVVLGPPHGAPGGSMDVVALGCAGRITLAFDDPGIVEVNGPDFIVFENAFPTGDETFAEPARVLVSEDGIDWRAFDCVVDGDGAWPPTGCAGIEPVAADGEPATDPATAGGDAFDLAEVGLGHARYVRLVDVSEEHYGERKWCGGEAGGFDLDAVARVERG